MSTTVQEGAVAERFPLSVVMQYRDAGDRPWDVGQWTVAGVVGGDHGPARPASDGTGPRLFGGFSLRLFPDDAESYYFNLVADHPSVFVICEPGVSGDPEPRGVTVSYGEATSFMEVEEDVTAVAMPPEVYRWVEAYVLEHYVPEKRRKRKREDWKRPQR